MAAITQAEHVELEQRRRELLLEINAAPGTRAALEAAHGQVWDTDQLREEFEVLQFAAPVIVARQRSTGKLGSLFFQHHPRFYWGWSEHHKGT